VNQACPLSHLAPQKKHCASIVMSSLLISEEELGGFRGWSSRLGAQTFPGRNTSRSSAAWKALFGPRCPSRDTRAQTGGDNKLMGDNVYSAFPLAWANLRSPGPPGCRSAFLAYISSCPAVPTLRLNSWVPASWSVLCLTARLASAKTERDSRA